MRPRPHRPHRRHRTGAAIVAATVLVGIVTLASACGGGGEPDRVSRAEMVRRADATCTELLRDADRLRAAAKPGARGEAAAAEIDATRAVLGGQVDVFDGLRGPASTDATRERAVRNLQIADDGLQELRDAALDDDLTVDAAIRANPEVVQRFNRASAKASDALTRLGFLACVGVADG